MGETVMGSVLHLSPTYFRGLMSFCHRGLLVASGHTCMHTHTSMHGELGSLAVPLSSRSEHRAAGRWSYGKKKGGKEIEMDGVGVRMKGTKGQDDYTTVAF